jgi:N-acetylglutamate synthase-like GNAT family acetyltransferase
MPLQTLSKQLWDLDLCAGCPYDLGHGIAVVPGDFERIATFLRTEFRWMSETRSAPPPANILEAKRMYLAELSDALELQRDGQCVGVFLGSPEDWSTYYIRTFAVLPNAQHRSTVRRFFRDCLYEPLRSCGVERVFAYTSPKNVAMSRVFSELDFAVTGNNLSEGWGPMIRYTYFIDPHAEQDFTQRYGGAVAPRPQVVRPEARPMVAALDE